MSYSRRQLYAMGEPLGDSATRREVGGRIIYGGGSGGGGSQTSTSTQYTSTVPTYLKDEQKEVVARGLALAQQPFQPYTGERVSQFTPLQRQAFGAAEQQQVAPQLGLASGLAGLSGIQSFRDQGTAGSFMNPFLEQAIAPQLAGLARQSAIQGTQQQGEATQRGAFGGSRDAIMRAEREKNLLSQQSDVIGRGFADAFDRGQSQFNQEQQARLQAAGQLGQLGQQQFGQEMDITGLQQQFGGAQQQQIQRILDQQFDDFQTQRDFPFQQVGFASDVIQGRGGSTRSMRQQPSPSGLQTVAGLGSIAAGLGGAFAKGGSVGYADGGITGLLDDQQLAQRQQTASPMGQLAAAEEAQRRDAMRAVPANMPRDMDMTEQELMAALQQAMREGNETKARVIAEIIEERRMPESGIAGIAPDSVGEMPEGGLMAMAGGGMVSFQAGGVTEADANFDQARSQYQQKLDELRKFGGAQKLRNPYAYQSALQAEAAAKQNLQSAKQNRQQVLHAIGLGPVGAFARSEGRPEDSAGVMALESTAPVEPDAFNLAASATPATPAPAGLEQIVPGQAATDAMRNQSRAAQRNAAQARMAEQKALEEAAAPADVPPGMSIDQQIDMARRFGIDPQAAADRQTELAQQQDAARRTAAEEGMTDFERMVQERGVFGEEQEARNKEEIEALTGKKTSAKNMALLQAGLAILSADPSRGGLAAIGEGAAKGLAGYKGDLDKLDATREKINGRMDRILELRRAESSADGKERLALRRERSKLEELAIADHRQIAGDLDKGNAALGKMMYDANIRMREGELNRRSLEARAGAGAGGRKFDELTAAQKSKLKLDAEKLWNGMKFLEQRAVTDAGLTREQWVNQKARSLIDGPDADSAEVPTGANFSRADELAGISP